MLILPLCTILVTHMQSSSAAVNQLNEFLTPPAAPKLQSLHNIVRQQRNHQFDHNQNIHFNSQRPMQLSPTPSKVEEPSFMQRIAQWFFPGSDEQDLTPPVPQQPASHSQHIPRYVAQPTQNHHQQAPSYYRHGHSVQHSHKDCNPCDKVPWTPIFKPHAPGYNQHNQQNQHSQNHQQYHQQNNAQYSAPPASSSHQYSTLNQGGHPHLTSKEYLPPPDVLPLATSNLHTVPLAGRPIALPNLSPTAIPPLFNAKPFNQGSSLTKYGSQQQEGSEHLVTHQVFNNQQINDASLSTNPYGPPVIPYRKPMYDDGEIQVIPSVPIAEFVSSVEYPPNIIQSPVIDIDNISQNLPGFPNENLQPNLVVPEYDAPERNTVIPNHQDSHPAASTYNISVDNDKLEQINSVPNYDSYGNKLEIFDDAQTSTQRPYFVTNIPSAITGVPSLQTANNHAYETTDFSYSTANYNQDYFNPNIEQQTIYNNNQQNFDQNQKPLKNHNGENRGHRNTDINSQINDNDKSKQKDSPILYLNINPPQKSFKGFRDIHYRGKTVFTPSTLEYTTDVNYVSTSMLPPSPTAQIPWENIYNKQESVDLFPPPPPPKDLSPTKKPKQIQIIIPYMANSKPKLFINPELSVIQGRKVTSNGKQNVFLYGNKFPPVPEIEEDFHEQEESKIVTATAQTQKPMTTLKTISLPKVRDILKLVNYTKKEKNPKDDKFQKNLENHKSTATNTTEATKPANIKLSKNKAKVNETKDYHGDMIRLQKNIDDWTEQEYSKETKEYKSSTVSLKQSKKIPEEYLTTISVNSTETTTDPIIETTTVSYIDSVDNELKQNITIIGHISNSLFESSVSINTDSSDEKNSWKKIELSVSPVTNEKVYVVTPMPWSKKSYNWPELKPSGFVLPKHVTEKASASNEGKNGTNVSLPESGKLILYYCY